MKPLTSKIALVTGANRGIGYAIAQSLLEKGHTVIATARSIEKGVLAIEKLKQYGNVQFHQLDITNLEDIKQCVEYVTKTYGRLDSLINNAGINYDTWQTTENANLIEVRETFETNLIAPWQLVQSFLPLLKSGKNTSTIVNVSSGSGAFSSQNGSTPGYSLSKFALNGLTLQMANALKKYDILVNSVCPGWVRTDMGGSMAPKSAIQGADTIVWAALFEKGEPTGKFFRDRKEITF